MMFDVKALISEAHTKIFFGGRVLLTSCPACVSKSIPILGLYLQIQALVPWNSSYFSSRTFGESLQVTLKVVTYPSFCLLVLQKVTKTVELGCLGVSVG